MPKQVLIVEDDADSRIAITKLLKKIGYVVIPFASAEEANQTHRPFDAAVLDVRLPGQRGDEFALTLLRKYPELRVIFLTAEWDIEGIQRAAPGTRVLRKPLDNVQELVEGIEGK